MLSRHAPIVRARFLVGMQKDTIGCAPVGRAAPAGISTKYWLCIIVGLSLFCLSYRIPSKENLALRGPERGERVRRLVEEEASPPGVLAYDGDEVVGWAAVHPRADTAFARNRKIPHVDDLDVWSVWCIRVRPGHRGTGL